MELKVLKDLKVGDKVTVVPHIGQPHFATIDHITPTGRMTVEHSKYHSSGSQIGGRTWSRSWIRVPTEQDYKTIERNKRLARLKAVIWENAPDEMLERVIVILDEAKAQAKAKADAQAAAQTKEIKVD